MKIIQNNYKENQSTEQYICEECNSVFEYDENDIKADIDGDKIVFCPCCNHPCYIDYTPVTEDNIEFPTSFYHFGDGVNIEDDEITKDIKKCIKFLKENPNEPYRYIGSGNTFLCVFNHEDEYYIMVAKDYFDTGIDK